MALRRGAAPAGREGRGRRGEWFARSGVGGLGHLAIQYAKVMGLHVCAIDIDDAKLADAKRLGADLVIHVTSGEAAAAVTKGDRWRGAWRADYGAVARGFHAEYRYDASPRHVRADGVPPGEFPVPLFHVVANCITSRGSFIGTREDMAEELAFAAEGRVKARHRTAAVVGDRPDLRAATAWRCGVPCGP